MSEEVKIVDGSCDPQTYALIASNKSAELAIRPFLVTSPAINRSGAQTGEVGVFIRFRVHLQTPGFPEAQVNTPTARVAKGWGLPLYERPNKYWRNDVRLQVAIYGQADTKYLTKKVRAGMDTVLEALTENINVKVKLCDKEATIDWLVGRLEHQIASYGELSEGKNKAALLSTPTFEADGTI